MHIITKYENGAQKTHKGHNIQLCKISFKFYHPKMNKNACDYPPENFYWQNILTLFLKLLI